MKEKSTIPSPCISVCSMDEDSGFCRGCYRTLDEIADWDKLNDKRKSEIVTLLSERRALHKTDGHLHC